MWFHSAMRLTRGKKVALAIATAWPPVYMIVFLCFILITFLTFVSAAQGGTPPKGIPTPFLIIFPLHIFTMLLSLALLVVYVLHALQNEKLDRSSRPLWAILIFVGSFIAMPIYFYKYVLPLRDDAG